MKRTPVLTLAVAALLTLSACGEDDPGSHDMPGMDDMASSSSTEDAAPRGTPAAGEHDDDDVAFAQGMIPHHAQAVEMSDLLLAKEGVDAAITDLAEQIKDAQQPEIDQMAGWLEGWGEAVPDTGMEGMDDSGDGMMSPQDMQALAEADGPEASRLFLEQMTEHHEGAIVMAEVELEDGTNEEAKELAQAIVDTQQAEIDTMAELLDAL